MATTKELQILITVANQAKAGLTQFVNDLAGIKAQVDQLATGLSDMGADGLSGVGEAGQKAAQGLDAAGAAAHRHAEETKAQNEEVSKLSENFEKLLNGIKFITGGFLALEAIHMAKEILDVSARAETLGVVLRVVGQNAGYTNEQLATTDQAVQKLGITAESSRQSLTQLIQSGISLSLAAPLARASQDLAVISGVNSSETFKRLVTNIEQMDTLGLRFMGIMIDRETVFSQAAANTGKALTLNAQKQIFANAVLAEAVKLNGTYEASMNSVGKLLTSFPRYVEEFKDALGSLGQSAYLAFVQGAIEVIGATKELVESFKVADEYTNLLGDDMSGTGENASVLSGAIHFVADAIKYFIDMLKENHEILTVLKDVVIGFGIYLAATFAIGRFVNFATLMKGVFDAIKFGIVDVVPWLARAALGFGEFWVAALGPVGLVLAGLAAVGVGVAVFWDGLKGKGESAVKSQKALVDDYITTTNKMVSKIKDEEAAVHDLQLARDRLATASNSDEKKAAESDVKAQQDRVNALQKQVEALKKERDQTADEIRKTGNPTADTSKRLKEVNDAAAKISEELTREKQFLPNLASALQTLGGDQNSFLHGVADKLQKEFSAVDLLMDSMENKLGDTNSSVSHTLQVLEKIIPTLTNTKELDAYFEKLDKFGAKAKELGFDYTDAIKNIKVEAQQQVDQQLAIVDAGGQKAYTQKVQLARRLAQITREEVNAEIALRKLQADIELDADKFRYEHGLILLSEYYAKRRIAIENDKQDQLDANAALIHSLEIERDIPGLSPQERAKYDYQIAQARANNAKIELKAAKDLQAAEIQSLNDRIKAEQSIAQLREDINNKTGNQEEAIRARAKRDEQDQLEALGKTGTEEDANLIRLRVRLDMEDKLSKLKLDDLDKELALQKSLLDLEDLKSNAQVNDGTGTTLDLQARLNDNIRKRIEYTEQLRDATLAERDAARDLGDIDRANTLNQKAVDLTRDMYTLRDSIKSVGAELQKTFTDSIASNFQAIIEHTKSFRQGLLDIFKDLNSQILKTLTKDVADNFVKALNGTQKDGGNLFDNLMSFITGKPTDSKKDVVLGRDKENALWVRQADPTRDPVEPGTVTPAADILGQLREIAKNTAEMAGKAVDRFKAESKGQIADVDKPPVIKFDPETANALIGRKDVPLSAKQTEISQESIFDQAAYQAGLGKYGLNGDFLKFMSLKESGLNPDAKSPAGAVGLMQVLPSTAKGLGYNDLQDPLTQVVVGAKYLAQQLEKYNGDLDKALSAYNSGPGNTDKAIASGNPFSQNKETKDYVATLGTSGKLLTKPTVADPMPVVVVQGNKSSLGDGKDLTTTVADAAQAKAKADQEDADATDDDTEATKESTSATKEATDTVNESNTTFREGVTVLAEFSNAVVQATYRLNQLGQGGGGKPVPGAPGSSDNPANDQNQIYDPSTIDGSPSAALKEGTTTKNTKDSPGTDTSGFFNTITGPISAAAGLAVGSKVGGNWGPFAGLLTTLLTPKLLKSMFDPLQAAMKDGFDKTGKDASSDVQGMAGQVGSSLSSFFGTFGQWVSQFFSSFSGGGSAGAGLGGWLGSLFGGGAVDGAASAGSVANVLFAEGGLVSGPGTGTSDSIHAQISNGEYVMTADKTAQFLPVLEAMRSGSLDGLSDMFSAFNVEIPQKTTYAAGGYVQANTVGGGSSNTTVARHAPAPVVHMTINTPDANSFLKSKNQIAAKTGAAISQATLRDK